jgi:hypothetical protein
MTVVAQISSSYAFLASAYPPLRPQALATDNVDPPPLHSPTTSSAAFPCSPYLFLTPTAPECRATLALPARLRSSRNLPDHLTQAPSRRQLLPRAYSLCCRPCYEPRLGRVDRRRRCMLLSLDPPTGRTSWTEIQPASARVNRLPVCDDACRSLRGRSASKPGIRTLPSGHGGRTNVALRDVQTKEDRTRSVEGLSTSPSTAVRLIHRPLFDREGSLASSISCCAFAGRQQRHSGQPRPCRFSRHPSQKGEQPQYSFNSIVRRTAFSSSR